MTNRFKGKSESFHRLKILPDELVLENLANLEALSEEELSLWWDCKFLIRKNRILALLGSEIDSYPKCKAAFVI